MSYLRGTREPDGRVTPPAPLADLLSRPLVAYLATQRPDGSLQCNPMWFKYDGRHILLSHTSDRQKWRNMLASPAVSLAVADPNNPFRYIEVRGRVTGSSPDEDAQFHRSLRSSYGMRPDPVPDADRRIIISIAPEFMGGRQMEDPTRSEQDEAPSE